jgi:hypothetical protein
VTIPTGRRGTSTRQLRQWFASAEGTAAIQAGHELATSLLQALNANDRAALKALTRSAGRR